MYNGTFNISTTKVNSTLNWTDEVYNGTINTGSSTFTGTFIQVNSPVLEQRISDLENDWIIIAGNVEYTGNDVILTDGEVLECSYRSGIVYRYITNAEGANGYPLEDSFYSGFNGTNLTGLIVTRG